MRWGLYGMVAALATQATLSLAQAVRPDKPRRADARETVAPPRPDRPQPGVVSPRRDVAQPVTPATDYYPYDRRTGGM